MIKRLYILAFILSMQHLVCAQIKLEDLPIDIDALLKRTKLLEVKKGFNPVFKIGDFQINKVGLLGEKLKGVKLLGEIFQKKEGVEDIMKLYKTYRTGLVAYKVLAAGGVALTTYSAVRGLADNNFTSKDVRRLIYPALGSLATGVITKILTKAASYKAVDIFNGVARKTIKDILSVKPASETMGLGVYVKL
jgi:hypothetical protein